MRAGERETETMASQKESEGQNGDEAGHPGLREHRENTGDGGAGRRVKGLVALSLPSLAVQRHQSSALKESKSFISRRGNEA